MAATPQKPELLAIVGETASGKSALALKAAKAFNGEIIAADAWTVYKDFNIGTSKPSPEDQKQVRHHLINVTDASKGFNAPQFKKLAEGAIAEIQNRDKLPIMAGGTGLYIDSVLFDFGFLPDSNPAERQKLNQMTISELLKLAESQSIDLSDIDTRNKRRIIRAIEAKGLKPSKGDLKPQTLIVGLQIAQQELRARVEQRTEQMISDGLEKEVRELSNRYGWNSEPMKGTGYKEWQEYFEGKQTLQQIKERIISSTMNLAKRQRTWFRRNPHIHWFSSPEAAYKFIEQQL